MISGPTGSYRVCTLPKVVDRSTTLPKVSGLVYQLNGRVDVGCDGGFNAPTAAAPVTTSTVGCPSATLTARDEFDEVLGQAQVAPNFKLTRTSATAWVEGGYRRPRQG